MTVASETSKVQYNGDGATTDFSVTFKYTAKSQIVVVHADSDGVETTWVLGTQYTLTDPGASGTLTVIDTPTDYTPASGETLTIYRDPDFTQDSDYTTGGGLTAEGIEADLDTRVFQIQRLQEQIGRAPKLKQTTTTSAPTFPEPVATKIIGWNSAGDDLENVDSPTAAVTAAEAAQAAAETAQTNAETAATNAATSATNAATSATNAATSATAAQTAETNAETAETNAETAQAAAEAARDAAIAASENPALTFAFDNATADADPGAGEFRLDNATLASVTTIFIDNSDADANDVSGYFDSFDDIGDTSRRGHILIKGIDTETAFFVGLVTGSIVDGTGYRKISVTPIASGGTFTAGENFSVLFAPVGVTGTGDVTGPASSTDNAIARYDSTTGKIIQNSGITIDDSDNIAGAASFTLFGANGIDINPGSDADADLLTVGVTGAPILSWDESSDAFKTNKPVVISSDGNGDITHTIAGALVTSDLEVHSEGATDLGGLAIHRHTDVNNFGGHLLFLRSDGTHASPTLVDDGDTLGRIIGLGQDGTDYELAGEIRFVVDGTAAANQMPGAVDIYTNAGSQTLTRRVRFRANGSIDIVTGPLNLPNTGLHLADTGGDHDYIIAPGEDATADRTLTLDLNDADRTLDLTGNTTLAGGTHSGTNTGDETAATTSASGIVELATTAEVNTGTDTGRVPSVDALAGSYAGTKSIQMVVFDFGTAASTGDGAFYFHVPSALAGMDLVAVHAEVISAGTTGTTDIQIHNVTDAVDMLSTKLTIDSGETGSDTAATPAVINTSNDDVVENDLLRIDVDAVSTTPPDGLIVTMEFRLP